MAGVFEHQVAIGSIAEAPIGLCASARTGDQSVANFVKNQLRERVVRIEVRTVGQGQRILAIPRGVNLGRAFDPHAELLRCSQPNQIQWISVTVGNRALGHGTSLFSGRKGTVV
jgi:hypothetical protein